MTPEVERAPVDVEREEPRPPDEDARRREQLAREDELIEAGLL